MADPFRLIVSTFALLLAVLGWQLQAQAETIHKSPGDPRAYASFTLDNGLVALVISDPEADKAAASLNVDVGSIHDPERRQGLAHFLEHMLFLGTTKYPTAGEYQAYISEHGGMHNAFTAPDRTNYFFDIDSTYLEPALDRFAQFFTAPLFTADYVQRERHAVNSEYQSKLKEDGRRIYAALKQVYNPEHPLSRFAVGNLDTLADLDAANGGKVRDELIAFYERYYSANLMSLVVLGKEPIDELKRLVTSKFSEVPNRKVVLPEIKAPLFKPGSLPAQLEVSTLKEMRELNLTFPLPPVEQHYHSKPLRYISTLLGNEGPGSLLLLLKTRGWADSLSAGTGYSASDVATLSVQIGLTETGMKHQDEIVGLVFQYLRLIKEGGIAQRYYDEERLLGEMNFRFKEPTRPVYEVSHLASRLRLFATSDLLSGEYLYKEYAPELIREYLRLLTPDNVLVSVVAAGLQTDQVDPWFSAPYRLQPVSAERRQRWLAVPADPGLKLPPPNPFIADNFDIKPAVETPAPRKIDTSAGFSLWHQQDATFKTPRADFYFSFRSPVANDSPRHAVMTALYLRLVEDQLNPITYPAYVAGLSTSIYPHIRGFSVRLSGYSQKQGLLLSEVLDALRNHRVDGERLEIYREELRQSLENSFKEKPYNQALDLVQLRLLDPRWSDRQKLDVLPDITAEELQAFIAELYQSGESVALAHGNLTEQDARELAKPIRSTLLAGVTPQAVPSGTTRQLEPIRRLEELSVEHNDSAISVYLQGQNSSFEERARYGLLAQILSAPFYHELRTQKQLGYVVFASPMPILEHPGIALVVQSPNTTGTDLESHIDQFLSSVPELITSLDETALARHKQSLILKLLKKEQRLNERSNRYWNEIDREHFGFDSREQLAAAIEAISKADLTSLSRQFTQRKLVVRSTGLALQQGLQPEPQASSSGKEA